MYKLNEIKCIDLIRSSLTIWFFYQINKTKCINLHQRSSLQIKKCHKKWEKSKRGGGISAKIQKVQNSKFGLFRFFPNLNVDFKCFSWTKSNLVLYWFLGNFKCFKLIFFVRGGFPKFNIFPIRSEGGGSLNFQFFPN